MNLLETRIDLDALAWNTQQLKQLAGPAQLMSVVKADAYRHGVQRVAPVMAANGADQFGVATIPEALQLRELGIEQPVLAWIWHPNQAIAQAIDAGVDLAVSSQAQAEALIGLDRRARVTIKVDTGMRRSGVLPSELLDLARRLEGSKLEITGLMSHFACADDPSSLVTDQQLEVFRRSIEECEAAGLELRCNHIANSPAALIRPDTYFDMIRPGIALYGHSPFRLSDAASAAHVQLRPAMRWVGRVSLVKPIARGEAVSYGHTWRAPADGTLAVVPVGYADGLPRAAQGHLRVRVGQRWCEQVGRVCMDQIIVYAPHARESAEETPAGAASPQCEGDAPELRPGAEATIFGGNGMPVAELAEAMGTIAYEIVCRPTGRSVRVYEGGNAHG